MEEDAFVSGAVRLLPRLAWQAGVSGGSKRAELACERGQARQHGFVSDAVLGISGIPCIFRPYLQNKGIEKIQKFTEKKKKIQEFIKKTQE
jgi:hypothetical protein